MKHVIKSLCSFTQRKFQNQNYKLPTCTSIIKNVYL